MKTIAQVQPIAPKKGCCNDQHFLHQKPNLQLAILWSTGEVSWECLVTCRTVRTACMGH